VPRDGRRQPIRSGKDQSLKLYTICTFDSEIGRMGRVYYTYDYIAADRQRAEIYHVLAGNLENYIVVEYMLQCTDNRTSPLCK